MSSETSPALLAIPRLHDPDVLVQLGFHTSNRLDD